MKLGCQRHLFSLDNKTIYLNGAYMSPMLKSVEKVGIDGVKRKRNPVELSSEKFFVELAELKKLVGELLGIADTERICTIPSASYGLANVAKNVDVEKGQSICLLDAQFPSNYYIWKRLADEKKSNLKIIGPPDELADRGRLWNERILEALTPEVALISIGHIHWADGTLFDLEAIRKRCDEIGAYLIIDGTQSIGALPFDQKMFRADAIICASYKWMFGPYSIGAAYYGKQFDDGNPIEENWINRYKSEDFKNLIDYQDSYRTGAQRYGVGESSNFILLPMINAAIRQLLSWKPQRFQEYCMRLTERSINVLRENGFWIEDPRYRVSHLFGIKIPRGVTVENIQAKLHAERINVSYRGNFIRASPSIYNTEEELSKFAKCLSDMA